MGGWGDGGRGRWGDGEMGRWGDGWANISDIPFYLINGVAPAPASITLQANSVTRVTLNREATLPLTYDVKNVITGENEVLKVELKY
jgi:hypothetical protein